jgi:hypothetical protein
LIPLLDSVVRKYLEDDDPGAQALFAERALELVRGYERDLDRNGPVLRAVRQELARRNIGLTEVRILDLLIFSAAAAARSADPRALPHRRLYCYLQDGETDTVGGRVVMRIPQEDGEQFD